MKKADSGVSGLPVKCFKGWRLLFQQKSPLEEGNGLIKAIKGEGIRGFPPNHSSKSPRHQAFWVPEPMCPAVQRGAMLRAFSSC